MSAGGAASATDIGKRSGDAGVSDMPEVGGVDTFDVPEGFEPPSGTFDVEESHRREKTGGLVATSTEFSLLWCVLSPLPTPHRRWRTCPRSLSPLSA
jgi:hypothetical protein